MQEKDNITQIINTFLGREESQKNKYKPNGTSQRPRNQSTTHNIAQSGKVQVG